MRIPFRLVLLLVVGSVASQTQAQTTKDAPSNLIPNGDFEAGRTGWGGSKTAQVIEQAGGGKYIKLVDGFLLAGKATITGGKKYRFNIDVRAENLVDYGAYAQLSFRGPGVMGWSGPISKPFPGSKRKAEAALFAFGGTHDWRHISIVVQAPARANHFFLYLRKGGQSGAVYYDKVSCEETTDPVTPSATLRKLGLAPAKPLFEDPDFCTETLLNTGFEKGLDHWVASGGVDLDTHTAPSEKKSLRITSGTVLQGVKIKPNKNYRVSVRIKTVDTDEGHVFVKTTYRGNRIRRPRPEGPYSVWDSRLTPAVVVTGGSHDWKEFSTIVKSNRQSDSILITLGKIRDEGTAWFDNLRIEESTDTPLTKEALVTQDLEQVFLKASTGPEKERLLREAINLGASPAKLIDLTLKGKTAYHIFASSPEHPIELHAARELASYLEQISGASFVPLATEASPVAGPLLIIGRHNPLIDTLAPDLPYDSLGDDGFIFKQVGRHLIIAGNQPRGTLYGVHYFLDRVLGVRWFSPYATQIPHQASISLKPLNETHIPRFTHRQVFAGDTADERYRAHNLLNGKTHHWISRRSPAGIDSWTQQGMVSGHNVQKIVSKKKYGAAHPEYFTGNQLAFMNEEVRQIATKSLINILSKKDYTRIYYTIGQMDHGWQPDADSQAFIDAHGGAWSAPILDFIKDVGSRVRKELPGATFCQSAYQWSFRPPENMTIPDWMMVQVCPIKSNYTYPLNAEENDPIRQQIEGWAKLTKRMIIWDYLTNFGSYIQPHPNLYQLGDSVKWLSTVAPMQGYFGQSSYTGTYSEFAELRTWVLARLLWDPSLNTKDLIREFSEGYYGEAAESVLRYIDMMQTEVVATKSKLQTRTAVAQPYLAFEIVRKADDLMKEAEESVKGNHRLLNRVQRVRIGIDYVTLLQRAEFSARAKELGVAWDPDVTRRLVRFANMMKTGDVRSLGEGVGNPDALIQAMKVQRVISAVPERCKGLAAADWVDFQDLALRNYGAAIVEDALASDHGALRMEGKTPNWGIQMRMDNLPQQGKWQLYVVVRVDPNEQVPDRLAMKLGVHPGYAREVKLSELADGDYHTFEIPGTYENEFGRALWFAPPNSDAISFMYVDRIFAIRKQQ